LIDQEVSEQLDIIPMRIQGLRHIRLSYGCPKDELNSNQGTTIPPRGASATVLIPLTLILLFNALFGIYGLKREVLILL